MNPLVMCIFCATSAVVMLALLGAAKVSERRRRTELKILLGDESAAAGMDPINISLLRDSDDNRSSVGLRLLRLLNLSDKLRARIAQAGLAWSLEKYLWVTALVAAITGFIGYAFAPETLAAAPRTLLFAGVGALLPCMFVSIKRSKRLAGCERQLPDALDFLARSVRAGHAFSISLEMLSRDLPAPLGVEFRTFANEQKLGAPFESAIRDLVVRVPLIDMRFFASSVLVQRQTGGNLGEILTRLAALMRDRFQIRTKVKALSAHGRMTAGVLTVLPMATTAGMLLLAPGYLQEMAADKHGRIMVVGSIVGQIFGNYVVRKIIKIKV